MPSDTASPVLRDCDVAKENKPITQRPGAIKSLFSAMPEQKICAKRVLESHASILRGKARGQGAECGPVLGIMTLD